MNNLTINKSKTCAVTGHRNVEKNFEKLNLEKEFINLIAQGVNMFLVGMAIGFDTICFNVLKKIREKSSIKIIACIPCKDQDAKFSDSQKKEYKEMLNSADDRVIISEKYTSYCMQKRNVFMVDNSQFLVCYLRDNKGGTFNTVNYAKRKNIEIINV